MSIFGRSKEPAELIPMSMTAALIDAFGMDRNKIDRLGLAALPGEDGPHWVTEEEFASSHPSVEEMLAELERDPNVRIILAAGDLAVSKTNDADI